MSETRAQNLKQGREFASDAAASTAAKPGQADTVERSGSAASEALRQVGETAAEVARRAGAAGAETLRRSTEALVESQCQIAQDTAERLTELSRTVADTAQETASDLRALMALPVVERGLQDLNHGLAGFVDGVVQTNLRLMQDLFRISSPIAYVEAQQRFMRDYLSVCMQGGAILVRAMRQTADQALPPLEQHLREREQRRHSEPQPSAGAYRSAA
ncbi:MAG: hypothetical protein JOZ05_06805 [Acetobacteraceae bacterium]|nr:hypothetical protein [Acetobacteraceae bacterium]